MKLCQSCHRENDDNAECCCNCGIKIEASSPPPSMELYELAFDSPLPAKFKVRFWLGAWLLVLLASVMMIPSAIPAAPFFPIGLLVWLPRGLNVAIKGWMVGAWALGWVFYGFYSVILFWVKKTGVFFILFLIFSILLLLNVAGCQKMMQEVSGIH